MKKINDGGNSIVEEIKKLKTLYSNEEYLKKLGEYLDTLGFSPDEENKNRLSSKEINVIKNQLKSTRKGSKENFKYLLEIIDNSYHFEDFKIIFEGEDYKKELDLLKNNSFDIDSMFRTFIAKKDNNFFNRSYINTYKGLNHLIKKGEIIELLVIKSNEGHKYSHLFTGQLNNGPKLFLNDFFYENYFELDPEKRIFIVENFFN